MSVIGINNACRTWQAGSYTEVGTIQDSGAAPAMSFASLMAGRLNGQLNNSDPSDAGVIQKATKAAVNVKTADTQEGIRNESVNVQTKESASKTAQTTSGQGTSGTRNVQTDNELTQEDLDKAMEVIGSVLQQFAELLEVTVQELQGCFEKLGIDTSEMLDADNLAKLVLMLGGGEDITDMLVDPEMLEDFEGLRNAVAQILDAQGTDAEEFAAITASEAFEDTVGGKEVTDVIGHLDTVVNSDRPAGRTSETLGDTEVSDDTASVKEPTVTYTRTGESTRLDRNGSDEEGRSMRQGSDTERTEGRETGRREAVTQVRNDAQGFIAGMQNALKTTSTEMMLNEMGTSVRDIVYQLVDAVKVNIGGDNTSLEMQLTPESLGKVQLNISSKDGVMTAHIITEDRTAKEAIESQLQTLKDTITEQGFKVDAIEVTVSNFSFSDSRNAAHSDEERGQSSGHGSKAGRMSAEEITPADNGEEIRREVMLQTGSTVSYVA